MGNPQNGWFIMEILIKMDDLGVPPFQNALELELRYGKATTMSRQDEQRLSMICECCLGTPFHPMF